MTTINFEEVFGSEFKIPQIIAKDIIEVQPMNIPNDFIELQEKFEYEIRRTFGYNENAIEEFPEFFTEEEFNL